jgi:starch phosphorylase
MDIAYRLIPGVDIWLNTPMRLLEASGTSGMKAALNGVPNFSVLDGWWIEGHIKGTTGWSIGPPPTETSVESNNTAEDVEDLYSKLEKVILPPPFMKTVPSGSTS